MWGALAACSGEQAPVGVAPPAVPARALPGPGPQLRAKGMDVVAQNEACARCHVEIAAEWRASQHRSAWDDEVFLSAYAVEPIPFCRRCHAPEIDEEKAGHDPSRHVGVGCVTCHVLGEDVLGARAMPGTKDAHPVMREPQMTEPAWCSGCHQFAFPIPQEAAMQSTLQEHRESKLGDRSCQQCHMPLVEGAPRPHRSHAFVVQGDAPMLRAAFSARAERTGERSIRVWLRVEGAGHAVPTGDMFRRLEIRAAARFEGDEQSMARPVVLAREFRREERPDGPRRLQIGDNRLAADGTPTEVELFFPRKIIGRPVEWEVVYQRMGPHEAAVFGVDLAGDETKVWSGVLAAEGQYQRAVVPKDAAATSGR